MFCTQCGYQLEGGEKYCPNCGKRQVGKSANSQFFVPAKCTQCGADVAVDPEKEAAICKHCNTPFIVKDAIARVRVYDYSQNVTKNTSNLFTVHNYNTERKRMNFWELVNEEEKRAQERDRQKTPEERKQELEDRKHESIIVIVALSALIFLIIVLLLLI